MVVPTLHGNKSKSKSSTMSNINIHTNGNTGVRRREVSLFPVTRILSAFVVVTVVLVCMAINGGIDEPSGDAWGQDEGNVKSDMMASASSSPASAVKSDGTVIVSGTLPRTAVKYYNCAHPSNDGSGGRGNRLSQKASRQQQERVPQLAHQETIILLHGARFTKEDWKTSGILSQLCQETAVWALDLSVQSDHVALRKVLDEIGAPASHVTLVTPSASGKAVTTWIQHASSTPRLDIYLQRWIPVACGSVKSLTQQQLDDVTIPHVLAVYGDQDVRLGKATSQRFDKSLELQGKHAVYLDSPFEFVSSVLNFVKTT